MGNQKMTALNWVRVSAACGDPAAVCFSGIDEGKNSKLHNRRKRYSIMVTLKNCVGKYDWVS